jgi:hypothetical protein
MYFFSSSIKVWKTMDRAEKLIHFTKTILENSNSGKELQTFAVTAKKRNFNPILYEISL